MWQWSFSSKSDYKTEDNNKLWKEKQKQRWDINRLNSQEIVHAYQENIETQIDKTELSEDINEEWTNIKTTIVNSAKEIIGIRKRKKWLVWWRMQGGNSGKE